MRIIFDKEVLAQNYAAVKDIAAKKGLALTLTSKRFYQDLFMEFPEPRWTFNESGERTYDILASNPQDYKASLHVDASRIVHGCNVWVPVITTEKREGVSINMAQVIKNYCLLHGINFEGVVMNFGCANNVVPAFDTLQFLISQVREYLGESAKISIGGSMFLDMSLPPGVHEIRVGEAILCGKIPYSKTSIGRNPFSVEYDVIKDFHDRVLIDAGRRNLTKCSEFAGMSIDSISTEYAVLKKRKKIHVGPKVICSPSYNTLSLIL